MSQNPLISADALAEAAQHLHGPTFHTRGGGAGRAAALVQKGIPLEEAIATAARQAKGHAAELRVSTQFTARAGVAGIDSIARPNPVSNDPHIDVEILEAGLRVSGAQVGVGSAQYIAKKASKSLAPQVVVNAEARRTLETSSGAAFDRTSDRLTHGGVSTSPLSEVTSTESAVEAIGRALSKRPLSFDVKAGLAMQAGATSALVNGCSALVFDVVERCFTGKALDSTVIETALRSGARSFVTTTVQTYVQVSRYFRQARAAFSAKLLQKIASNTHWAGAVAEFVVETSHNVLRWIRNEIDFDELLRRAGVTAFSATGAALGAIGASRLVVGAPWWVQLLVVGGAAIGGGHLGRQLGESVFAKDMMPSTAPAGE